MAKITLGPQEDIREEKSAEELRKIIADSLNKADGTRTVQPNDVVIITQENGRGSWSHGVKNEAGLRSMTQKMADDRIISDLNNKYKTKD